MFRHILEDKIRNTATLNNSGAKAHIIILSNKISPFTAKENLTFEISGLRPIEEAIVTSGGVDVKEINPKTMESKLVKNLYFAGEILDVDAFTGGFNLQIAFSTGYLIAFLSIFLFIQSIISTSRTSDN
jgi:predicted flavoprotein YhiN